MRRARSFVLLVLALAAASGCAKPSGDPPPSTSAAPAATPPPTAAQAAPAPAPAAPAPAAQDDTLATSAGDVRITPIHHGTLMLSFSGKNIYVDPWTEGRLEGRPKADLVLVTDIHQDHFDKRAIDLVKKADTVFVAPPAVAKDLPGAIAVKNGETTTALGIRIEAVPMYNLKRGPSAGQLYHDKGRGNGYVLGFGDERVYLSGDTECTEEMRALKDIDVAFVCMNLPFTMPPGEAAECIQAFRPKIVYPYHYRGSNLEELRSALAGQPGIEVRIRAWYPEGAR